MVPQPIRRTPIMTHTPKLSDIQLILLTTACQRADGSLLPPPDSLGEQAARIKKAIASLLKRHLAEEMEVTDGARAWRLEGERQFGVVISFAGRAIIRAEEADAATVTMTDKADGEREPLSFAAGLLPANAAPAVLAARTGTKQALLIDLLAREKGASLDELTAATGWLPHTMRAALTGLRKKGHALDKERNSGVTRYRILKAA
jgi:hypothetical protein